MNEGSSLLRRLNIRKNVYFALGEFSINVALVFFGNALGIPAHMRSMASGHMRSTILVTTGTLVGLVLSGVLLGEMFAGTGAVGASAGAIGLCGIAVWLTNPQADYCRRSHGVDICLCCT